jgi:hypothetical protein
MGLTDVVTPLLLHLNHDFGRSPTEFCFHPIEQALHPATQEVGIGISAYLCSPNLEMRQNNYIHTRYKSFGLV